jgi:hypothetical protein
MTATALGVNLIDAWGSFKVPGVDKVDSSARIGGHGATFFELRTGRRAT